MKERKKRTKQRFSHFPFPFLSFSFLVMTLICILIFCSSLWILIASVLCFDLLSFCVETFCLSVHLTELTHVLIWRFCFILLLCFKTSTLTFWVYMLCLRMIITVRSPVFSCSGWDVF